MGGLLRKREGERRETGAYSKILQQAQPTVVQQRIVPVPIPILKEDAIELIIHPGVRSAQVNRHITPRLRMDEEAMDRTRLHRDLAVVARDRFRRAVDYDAHQPGLDAEILRLELVEVQERALGFVGAVEEGAKVRRDVGAREVMFVGLAEEEASSWWGLEELRRQ